MLAEQVDGVIGVDTHRDTLAAAAVTRLGGVLAQITTSADAAGYRRLLDFAHLQLPGRRCWAVEGTGSFGAGLAGFLLQQGEWVVEVGRPKRPASRSGAKSDALDAVRAAREALSQDRLATPRRRGQREALRVLLTTRRCATLARVAAIGQLKALLVGAPEELRAELGGRSTASQIHYCASMRTRPTRSLEHQATVRALRATAQRIQALAAEADELEAELTVLVGAVAPWLLEVPGVGPLSAAQVLVSWSHAGRFRSEAAFAALAGTNPIPASSGQVTAFGSTAAATGSSTARCTPSCWCVCASIPTPTPTWPAAPPRARAAATPSGACDTSSPGSCSGCSNTTTDLASRSSGRLDST
jgi:transposase